MYRNDYGIKKQEGIMANAMKISASGKKRALSREVWVGWFSSLSEAYNMAIYSFTAPFLAKLIFSQETPWSAVFFSYCLVFLGSCLFYPLGAAYYGLIGDRRGRNRTCLYSTFGLAVATGLMGLVPIQLFGNWAWAIFCLLICMQYFFSGGEYSGSIVFALEHAEGEKNGLMSGLSCLFAVLGLLLANGFAAFSLHTQNELWIRTCFLIGAGGGILSYLLKNHCRETPAFTAISKESLDSIGIFSLIREKWPRILGTVLVIGLFFIYAMFIFLVLPLAYGDAAASEGFETFKSLIVYGICLVWAGFAADRIGVVRMMAVGAGSLAIGILPLSYFLHNLQLLQLILTVLACLIIGPVHSWTIRQFPAHERCRGVFISSAIAMSLFGGSTVPFCLLLLEKFDSLTICCIYPAAMSALTFGYLLLKKT